MSFPKLLEVALAGTLRQAPPTAIGDQELMSAETLLLRGASYEGLRRLAGRPLEHADGLVPPEPAPPESVNEIPPAAAIRLVEILEGRLDLLHEWLQLVVERHLRVPPLSLPDLLEYARTETDSDSDSDVRELIRQVGGERLAWLAGLNPDWHFAANARSAADESLLERAPRDPNSQFGQRWAERARRVIIMKTDRVDIREPIDIDPTWTEDGFDARRLTDSGTTASVVRQLMALTPPSIWPPEALDAIGHSDWSQPLLAGLAEAAQAYAHADWCERLVMLASTATVPFDPAGLFGALEQPRAESVLQQVIERSPALATRLVGTRSEPWSLAFSRIVMQQLPGLWAKHPNSISAFLDDAALRLEPRVLPEVDRLLDLRIEPIWVRSLLQSLAQTLDYRLTMRTELDDQASPPA